MHSQTKKVQKAWEINQPATAKVSHAWTKVKVMPFRVATEKLAEKSDFFGANLDLRSVMLMLAAKRFE